MIIHVDNNGVQHNIKEIRHRSKILPDGVELHEYLESTGTLWIDLLYSVGSNNISNMKLYIDFIATSTGVGNRWWVHGIGGSTSAGLTFHAGLDNGTSGTTNLPFVYGNGLSDIVTTVKGNLDTRYKYTLDLKNKTYTVKNEAGTALVNLSNITLGTPTNTQNMCIYAWRRGNNGNIGYSHSDKIFEYKLYDNDILVRNMLPCTYNGVAGMWDTVESKFYDNSGTGTFVLGPKINLDEYEYLLSTGTLYINTEIPYDSTKLTYKIECKFSLPSNVGLYDAIFGAYTGESYKCLRIIRGNSNSVMWTYYNNQANSGNKVAFSTANTNIREIVITSSSTILTENGTTTTYENKAINGTNTTSTFYLFCQGIANDSPICLSKSIIYYFRLYDNDTLIKDFVPVSYNRTPGLWDKVEMKFYPNAGTGTFTLGPKKYDYNKIHQIRKAKRLLPNGVELYEYIESTGTLHIDTGVIPDNNTQTNIKYLYTDTGNLNLFGSYDTSSKAYIVNIYNNKLEYNYYNSRWVSDINVTRGEVINLNFNKNNKIYVNGTQVKSLSTNSFTETRTVYIFSRNGGTVSAHYKGKIYHFLMLLNGVLIRNMLPCRYYGEPGMWDTVENKFYGNIGSYDFVLGLKLNLKLYEYLESTGTQWIDTGVYGYMNHTYEIEFLQNDTGNYRLWGVFGLSSYVGYNMSLTYGGGWMTRWSSTSSGENSVSLSSIDTNKHKFKVINGLNYFDDVSKGTSSGHNTDFSIDHNLFLFTINPAGATPTTNAKAKIYSYKDIDVNNNLIRDMVPCTCNGVPGMWDKLEWKFYDNKGTGQFNIGGKLLYDIININYYRNRFFTTIALEDGIISFTILKEQTISDVTSMSYSFDNGKTWTTIYNSDDKTSDLRTNVSVSKGDVVIWKGNASTLGKKIDNNDEGSFFSSTCTFNVEGNLMSLLYGNNFVNQNIAPNCAFANLFSSYDGSGTPAKVVDASNLEFPYKISEKSCMFMFYQCEDLIKSPKTLSFEVGISSCEDMFTECTSLTTVPKLPATTLAANCYYDMFYNCTSLITAPKLPATTLATYCYSNMFSGCTSLTVAPKLPATTLASRCYSDMFYECTSLTTAPELSATSLANYCYYNMFSGCTSLITAPELPATTLANYCYNHMFYGCKNLTTAPELPAITLVSSCYNQMFYGCNKLNYIKALFTTTPGTSYTLNWVSRVASTGTFVKNSASQWDVIGVSGIPTGWTVQTASS